MRDCQAYTCGSRRSPEHSRGHSCSCGTAERVNLRFAVSSMSQRKDALRSRVEATYKAREVEGVLDLYFYRPIGFRLAELFAQLKMTPATVTLLAGLCGIIAGRLYYYPDLRINIVGMVLHVCANALDNADGQLARLTQTESRKGRVIDSIADHLVFVSIYL